MVYDFLPLAPGEFFGKCPKAIAPYTPCGFTTSDRAAWTEHMKAHGKRELIRKAWMRDTPWKAPRLSVEGEDFTPGEGTITLKIADIEAAHPYPVTAKFLGRYAVDLEACGHKGAATILDLIADALPTPWPTAPGSVARTDTWAGDETRIACLDENGDWYVVGYDPGVYTVADLRELGFVPTHDAGAKA